MSNIENADLLTNASVALERYRAEEQLLEVEVSIAQAKLEQVREFVAALSGKRRAGRPRKPPEPLALVEMPQRVTGAQSVGGGLGEPGDAA
jgi:hypothetical protein